MCTGVGWVGQGQVAPVFEGFVKASMKDTIIDHPGSRGKGNHELPVLWHPAVSQWCWHREFL